MKKLILFVMLWTPAVLLSQSYYTSFRFAVTDEKTTADTCKEFITFSINTYDLKSDIRTVSDSAIYSSKYDWNMFESNNNSDFIFDKYMPGRKDETNELRIKFTSGESPFETVYEFVLARTKCGKSDQMTLIYPVVVHSAKKYIDLGSFRFIPGYFNLTGSINYRVEENTKLYVTLPESYWLNK